MKGFELGVFEELAYEMGIVERKLGQLIWTEDFQKFVKEELGWKYDSMSNEWYKGTSSMRPVGPHEFLAGICVHESLAPNQIKESYLEYKSRI